MVTGIAPASAEFDAAGGNGSFAVSVNGPECTWSGTTTAEWITLTAGSGTGSGTLTYTVEANTVVAQRSGTISIGGFTHTVTQEAAECVVLTVDPPAATFTFAGGSGSFAVVVNDESCEWSASTEAPWIALTTVSGTGAGTVSYTVAEHTLVANRTGTILVGGVVHTVTQTGTGVGEGFDGWVAESRLETVEGVTYAVVDIFAQFDSATLRTVNVYDASIAARNGTPFHHSDLDVVDGSGLGTWSVVFSTSGFGLSAAIDSFVLIGGPIGFANTTQFDPAFTPQVGPTVPIGGGWFNGNPPNNQGTANPSTLRVQVGRFSIVAGAAEVLEFEASLSFGPITSNEPRFGSASIEVPFPQP